MSHGPWQQEAERKCQTEKRKKNGEATKGRVHDGLIHRASR